MSEYYNLPDELGGLLLPTVEGIIKLGKKKGLSDERVNLAKTLGDILSLREFALSIKPYQEHSFTEISVVSYELLEEPLGEEKSPYIGLSLQDKTMLLAQKEIERYQKERKEEREAKKYARQVIDTITLQGLEYLSNFHYLLDGIDFVREDLLRKFPGLEKEFALREIELKEKYGEVVRGYHIIPETIDWNFYLTIRGKEPEDLYSPYDRVLTKIYLFAQLEDATKKAKEYLDKNPDKLEDIAKGRPPVEDASLPRNPIEVKALTKEAYRRLSGKVEKEEPPDIELDEEKEDAKV